MPTGRKLLGGGDSNRQSPGDVGASAGTCNRHPVGGLFARFEVLPEHWPPDSKGSPDTSDSAWLLNVRFTI